MNIISGFAVAPAPLDWLCFTVTVALFFRDCGSRNLHGLAVLMHNLRDAQFEAAYSFAGNVFLRTVLTAHDTLPFAPLELVAHDFRLRFTPLEFVGVYYTTIGGVW